MFFDTWSSLGRVAIACVLGYAAIVMLLRSAGKRSLSQLNAFDFVINVAIGSTLATFILSNRVPVANGIVAIALLVGLQFALSWLAVRSSAVQAVVKARPSLLFYRGEFQTPTMRRERIAEDEIRAAVRQQGVIGFERVEAVILETSGDLSVVLADDVVPTAMEGVDDVRPRRASMHPSPAHRPS